MRRKLELTWPHKEDVLLRLDERGEPVWGTWDDVDARLLIQQAHYGDPDAENMLIKGDNLLALQALLPRFAGQVKLIYIDPPFNTGSAYEYYDDGLEHSIWLTMMRDRLRLLRKLLREDGAFFLHLSDVEMHYAKIVLDEIFGRENYLATIVVRMRHPKRILLADRDIHDIMDYVLFYCRNRQHFTPKKQLRDVSNIDAYIYQVKELGKPRIEEIGGKKLEIFRPEDYGLVRTKLPSKRNLRKENIRASIMDRNSTTRFYRDYLRQRLESDGWATLYKVDGIGADGLGYRYIMQPREGYKNGNYLQGYPVEKDDFEEMPLPNFIDVSSEMASAKLANEGGVRLPKGKKTEHLVKAFIEWANCLEGDTVLDSFAGSGTTGAVAHKIACKWIMVEIGEHAETLIIPRMQRVISGEDQTGISQEVDWVGGGGFTYYALGESVVGKDAATGVWVLNYSNGPLIEAICLREGFTIIADGDLHGRKGHRYAHVADEHVTNEYVNTLLAQLEDHERLTVYCQSHDPYLQGNDKVDIKRIPQALVEEHRR